MHFILKKPGQEVYVLRPCPDSDKGPDVTTDGQQAQVFSARVDKGIMRTEPELPVGDWDVVGVRVSLL